MRIDDYAKNFVEKVNADMYFIEQNPIAPLMFWCDGAVFGIYLHGQPLWDSEEGEELDREIFVTKIQQRAKELANLAATVLTVKL